MRREDPDQAPPTSVPPTEPGEGKVGRQLRPQRPFTRQHRTREAGEPDTRQRIQVVALELFTANGYEATSLREIAERLGVTKAALYYHFRTKDEIIDSLFADRMAKVSELISWAESQPRSVATRREMLIRYSDMLDEETHHGLMRFFERNQAVMAQHKAGVTMRERMVQFLDTLVDRDAPLPDQIRCSLAMFALHSTSFTIRNPHFTNEQRRDAALKVALELIEPDNRLAESDSAPVQPGQTDAG
jgi:AcrR family transcriptional regulator